MSNPIQLSIGDEAQILDALRAALPKGPEVEIDDEAISRRGGELIVPILPKTYPDDATGFKKVIAEAESLLRDAGLKVRLAPEVPQRLLVVATPMGRPTVAYLSTDGSEERDLAKLFGIDQKVLGSVGIESYAYDTPEELAETLEDVRSEYPNLDFSGIVS